MGLKKPAVGGKRVAKGIGKPFQPQGSASWVVEVRGLSFKPSVVATKPKKSQIDADYPYRVGTVGIARTAFEPPLDEDLLNMINNDGDYSVGRVVTFYDDGFKIYLDKGNEQPWVAYE
ncbi:hypothetical protein O144_gp23 [Bacillus phage Wip1]|uniref:Uncharacterized protein n=1 Tax=Bacillus phage Wip1 TaxID=663237 RepID=S5Y6J6_9VIRU|nr:hypothetical protein O144_gp23 [Bacillus phage Wip1]AGT13382.1 hypothetical protein [Bacillus phage Wip1]